MELTPEQLMAHLKEVVWDLHVATLRAQLAEARLAAMEASQEPAGGQGAGST